MLVVQLEKKEAMREEEEKKRKALKRRTIKEQVRNSPNGLVEHDLRKRAFCREATVEAEVGVARAAAAAATRAPRAGARAAGTRVAAAAAKATGVNRGVKGTTMEATGRRAASRRHRVVRERDACRPFHYLASQICP